jgi:hypothetical protein
MKTLIDKLIRDKDGNVAIWQMPNLPLWLWIVATLLGFVTHGTLHEHISIVGSAVIIIWAALEIGWGAAIIRRLIGAVVLVAAAGNLIMQLYK